ncbi:hypothetical protein CEV32_3358 [Brucella rhizosphaerae]|uniref:Uncharacterized protein n=1 Tax=Brucella rhizosphaerae TaxID=571254 RepID=A0A256FU00_9HYPH|nr:hypothetical protein CEV32_3358 [Brucella rhizosphaerae]
MMRFKDHHRDFRTSGSQASISDLDHAIYDFGGNLSAN